MLGLGAEQKDVIVPTQPTVPTSPVTSLLELLIIPGNLVYNTLPLELQNKINKGIAVAFFMSTIPGSMVFAISSSAIIYFMLWKGMKS